MVSEALKAASIKILTVGSGDGSQQASIVRTGHRNIVVTFKDTRAEVLSKYPSARASLQYLDAQHVEQLFSIDVATLGTGALQGRKFDCVVFNFPHVGGDTGRPEVLAQNRSLVSTYLSGALRVLAPGGEVQLAVKTEGSYKKWDVLGLVRDNGGLTVARRAPLDATLFPGYVHRLTKGASGSKQSVVNHDGAEVFVLTATDNSNSDEDEDDDDEDGENDEEGGSIKSASSGKLSSLTNSRGSGDTSLSEQLEKLNARVILVSLHVPPAALTDEQLEEAILSSLALAGSTGKCAEGPNVLHLRRAVAAALDLDLELGPNTRQYNRVLYDMERRGSIRSLPQGPESQKPTWALAT